MKSISNILTRAAAKGVIGLGVAFTALGSLTAPASAVLMSADLFAPGDGLLTQDSVSGFEWLDLTETLGRSYNTVAGGFGGFTNIHGFGFANSTLVGELFINAGIPNPGSRTAANFLPAQSLFALTGCTGNCVSGNPFSRGYADNDPANTLAAAPFVLLLALSTTTPLGQTFSSNEIRNKDEANSFIGTWLYRETRAVSAVPLPAALPLFGTGLGILGFLGWRRRQQAATAV